MDTESLTTRRAPLAVVVCRDGVAAAGLAKEVKEKEVKEEVEQGAEDVKRRLTKRMMQCLVTEAR